MPIIVHEMSSAKLPLIRGSGNVEKMENFGRSKVSGDSGLEKVRKNSE